MSNPLYEAANAAVARGLSVIPIRLDKANKVPAVRWKPHQTRRPNDAELHRWFIDGRGFKSEIIGLAVICGPVSGGIAVRDFDTVKSYRRWAAGHPNLAVKLPTVKTARGFHVYFTFTGHIEKAALPYIDGELRVGVGAYVCMPPTLHPGGKRYEWVIPLGKGPPMEIADVVAAGFVGKSKSKPKPIKKCKGIVTALPRSNSDPSNGLLARALWNCTGRTRNDRAVWLACQLRDAAVPQLQAERVMREFAASVPGGSHPYTKEEASATLLSIYATPARAPAKVRGPWHNALPPWILELPCLRPYDRVLLQLIADKCDGEPIDRQGSRGYCIAGYDTLAEWTHMCKRTVIRRMKGLLASGLAVLVSRGGIENSGELCANVYAIPGVFGALDSRKYKSRRPRRFEGMKKVIQGDTLTRTIYRR